MTATVRYLVFTLEAFYGSSHGIVTTDIHIISQSRILMEEILQILFFREYMMTTTVAFISKKPRRFLCI